MIHNSELRPGAMAVQNTADGIRAVDYSNV